MRRRTRLRRVVRWLLAADVKSPRAALTTWFASNLDALRVALMKPRMDRDHEEDAKEGEEGATMEKRHLVDKLLEMRNAGAPYRRVSAMTHLFGIIFAEDIRRSRTTPPQIARDAGNENWCGLITDGQNLAEYVTVKPEHLERWRR